MSKRMKIMLLSVGILFGVIFLYKMITGLMLKYYIANQSHIVEVGSMQVNLSDWQPKLTASGSMRAIRGVGVTTELAGMVQTIHFTPGSMVKEGDVLVQLNADNDVAALRALEANSELARITYERDKAQFAVKAVSKQVVDNDAANLKNYQAQVAQQAAIVAKKTIKAPFAGRLGINNINPGQFVNPGDKVVSLQTLDPIYADFYLPQQTLAQLKTGLPVTVTSDTYPGKIFKGTITTIEPNVDVSTRNVLVEATIANPNYELAPGMFTYVEITMGKPQQFLTLPQTAISFNPYGDMVYVIHDKGKDSKGPILNVTQVFVTTGETRGEQIQVLKGLKGGETIVTSGQLKLKNGTRVAINNSIMPSNNPAPVLNNNH